MNKNSLVRLLRPNYYYKFVIFLLVGCFVILAKKDYSQYISQLKEQTLQYRPLRGLVEDEVSENSCSCQSNRTKTGQLKSLYEDLNWYMFNKTSELNCDRILLGDTSYIKKAVETDKEETVYENNSQFMMPESKLATLAENCHEFRSERKYFNQSLSLEEESFSIAYIITIHKKASLFERLLRSVYHVQNVYCIHVDAKSSPEFYKTIKKIATCFPNVFMASFRTNVHYSHWTRVEADLNCFRDLLKKKQEYDWKYVMNLCGQDFPLKTNYEMVRVLKTLQGKNNMESLDVPQKAHRYEIHYELPVNGSEYDILHKTSILKTKSPLNSPMFAGSAYNIFTYEAVEYTITNDKVKEFFKWSEDGFSPDEFVWATLQRMHPDFPGSEPPHPKYDSNEFQALTRAAKWVGGGAPHCYGKYVRGVCVYGVKDLPWLITRHHFFANKFDEHQSISAIVCLEQWLRRKTITQALSYEINGFV